MNIKHVFCLLGLSAMIIAPAQAALDRIEETLELDRSQVDLPSYAGDSVVVRPCADCETQIFQASANTVYQLGYQGELVDLAAFRTAAFQRQAEDTLILISYSTEDQQVTRIMLSTPPVAASE
ncbi:MAG: hypothetical protein WBO47_11280 [Gammaproteobacteria bacterium]